MGYRRRSPSAGSSPSTCSPCGWRNPCFGRGYGADIIQSFDGWNGTTQAQADSQTDVLVFNANVAPADVTAARVGDHLLLASAGTPDSVQVTATSPGTPPSDHLATVRA